ncbi:TonB-dependent receptor domain-containing protein [Thaumasiovibrio subtropicus]|uniref:TonB-dependent receptor domain-containing protein n=1 Tax=Thaumasiovibrio subtropicus TaxID=1891207 RepID=UPI000B3583F3|nr:TonB-dependent receptor [Thaumasiovibrio subtropicus]
MSKKLWVAGMLPMAAFAQQTSPVVSENETVVVTASRFEQSVDNVIAPVSVVTREEIEQSQAKTLTEILRRLPGVETTVNGGIGQNASLFLRGTNSSHTLVLIDGVRMNNTITAGTNINRIPVNQVERVELIRGAGAAVYGSDAIGGVLNIITRSKRGTERQSIAVGTGSKAYREGNFASTGDISENSHLKIAAGFQQTDGFNVNPLPGLNDGDTHGFDGNQAMINYEHIIDDNWSLFGSLRWFDNVAEYNRCDYDYVSQSCSYMVAKAYNQSTSYTGRAEYNDSQYQSFFTVNYQEDRNYDDIGAALPISRLNIDQTNLQWANQYILSEALLLSGGIDWRRENLKDDALSYGFKHKAAGEKRDTRGIYAGAIFAHDALTLQASVRTDKHDEYDDYTTWSLGASYELNLSHRLYGSIGTAFKAPSFADLGGNPKLKPEESENLELGVEGFYSFADWSLSVYRNEVDNLQIYYTDIYMAKNIDADIRGLELEVNFDTGMVSHAVVAEYKDHEDTKGAQLARRAKQNYKWVGELTLDEVVVSLSYIYTGKRSDLPAVDASQIKNLEAYSLLDLGVSYFATPNLVFRGRIDNLLDEEYETTGGYPAPERAYYLSLDYKF